VIAADDVCFDQVISDASINIARCAGPSRASTVFNGILHLRAVGVGDEDWVMVHDAARCLVLPSQVQALISACRDDDVGGLLALPLPDTLKSASKGRVAVTLDRTDKWLAQTPQMFRLGVLYEALEKAAPNFDGITDESSSVEALGLHPRLVPGSAQNFKLTYPEDFALADAVLRSRST
jgi:2-C-methyl-D-erythritol 4-phosphate cytidylyltransferase